MFYILKGFHDLLKVPSSKPFQTHQSSPLLCRSHNSCHSIQKTRVSDSCSQTLVDFTLWWNYLSRTQVLKRYKSGDEVLFSFGWRPLHDLVLNWKSFSCPSILVKEIERNLDELSPSLDFFSLPHPTVTGILQAFSPFEPPLLHEFLVSLRNILHNTMTLKSDTSVDRLMIALAPTLILRP